MTTLIRYWASILAFWIIQLLGAQALTTQFTALSVNPDGTLRGPTNFLEANQLMRGRVFTNIAEALAATGLPHKSLVNVAGYYAANDGGGGIFCIDTGASSATNLGNIFTYGTGRMIRVREYGRVNVREFGAKGTGSGDDTAAIQNAIDSSLDGVVWFPSGTYIVSNLTVKRGIVFQGANTWNTILKAKSGATGWMITFDDTISGSQLDTEFNQVPTQIHGLTLEGSTRASDIGGIYLNHCDYFTVRDVFIWRFQRSALFLNNSVRETLFDNVSVRFCGKRDATNNNGGGWPAVSFVDWETSPSSVEDKLNGIRLQNSQIVFSLGDGLVIDTRQMSSGRKVNNISVQNCWIHGWSAAFSTVEFANTLTNSATLRQYDLVKIGASYDVRLLNNRFSFAGEGKPAVTLTTSTLGGSPVSGLTYTPEKVQVTGNFFNHAYSVPRITGEIGLKADAGSGIITDNISEGLGALQDLTIGWRSTLPQDSTVEGLTFDPTITGSYASGSMQQLAASPFTIHAKVRLPNGIPASAAAVFSLGSSVGTVSTPGFALYLSSNGNLYPVMYAGTFSDRVIATIPLTVTEPLFGQVVDFTFTRSSTTFKTYINGAEYPYVQETVGTPPAWSASLPSDKWNLGAGVGTPWASTLHEFRVANRALSAAEVAALTKGPVPSDMWGSMTVLTNGTLVVGFRYRINARASSDFMTVGASANTVGTEFVATGTGSGLLDASNNVIRLGWIVDPDLSGNSGTTVFDRSTNDADGALVGNGVKWVKTVGAAAAAAVSTAAAPIDQPDRGISWDGVTSGTYVNGNAQQLGTDPFSVHVRARFPSAFPTNNAGLFTLTTSIGSIAVNGGGLVLTSGGLLQFQIYGSTGSDFRIATVASNVLATYLGIPVDLVVTRSGSTLKIYANGTSLTYSEVTGGTAPAWSSSLTTDKYNVGLFTSGQVWLSSISLFRVANRALSAGEVAFMNGGPLPADTYGSTTILASGNLTIGKRYRITQFTDGLFTAVGAAVNTVGTEFVATGTGGGTLLDAGDKVQQIGWFLDLDMALGPSGRAWDRSSNGLHGTLVGGGAAATLRDAWQSFLYPVGDGQIQFKSIAGDPVTGIADGQLHFNSTEGAFRARQSGAYKNVRTGKLISATATLDFPSTAAQTDSDLTITVTGAVLGDVVYLGTPNASALSGGNFTAWVSAADTVKVRFSNYSSSAKDPASGVFRVAVEQY